MIRVLIKRSGAEAAIEHAKDWQSVVDGDGVSLESTRSGPKFEIESCNCTDRLCIVKSADAGSTPPIFGKIQAVYPQWIKDIVSDPMNVTNDEFNNLTNSENW